jgi:RNA polymerase sigma-70 factor (ECF subfamily)
MKKRDTGPEDISLASDEELMARFRDRHDQSTFEVLMRRHAGRAFAAAFRLLADRTDAEDAVQEAFLRVIRARRSYDPRRPFGPWFYTVLRNVCLDLREKRSRRLETVELSPERVETASAPEAPEPAVGLFDLLSPVERDVLTLKLHHNMTFREIGAALGCSEEAAKKRAQRAVARLRSILTPET